MLFGKVSAILFIYLIAFPAPSESCLSLFWWEVISWIFIGNSLYRCVANANLILFRSGFKRNISKQKGHVVEHGREKYTKIKLFIQRKIMNILHKYNTECARDRDLYKLVSCCKFVNEILFLYYLKYYFGASCPSCDFVFVPLFFELSTA